MLGANCPYIPTTDNCDEGQASVLQMDAIYQSLSPDLQSMYKSSHDAIMASYNGTWYTGIDLIPFNPSCGTMCALGNQAEGLSAQMQSAAGQVPIGVGPSGQANQSSLLSSLLGTGNTTLLVVGALVVGYLVLKK